MNRSVLPPYCTKKSKFKLQKEIGKKGRGEKRKKNKKKKKTKTGKEEVFRPEESHLKMGLIIGL